MKKHWRGVYWGVIWVMCVVLLFSVAMVCGEESTTTPPARSSVAPQLGKQTVWVEELGKIFGAQFSLTTSPEDGRISYELGDKEGLKYFLAKSGVHVKSETFEIKCDKLEYLGDKKVIIATGSPVTLRQKGINATCGRFVFDTEKKRTELTENPVIFSKDEAGRMVKTVGKRIYIEEGAGGNASVMVEGNAQLNIQSEVEAVKPTPTPTPEGPIRIDEKSLDNLKEVEVTE